MPHYSILPHNKAHMSNYHVWVLTDFIQYLQPPHQAAPLCL